MAKDKLQELGGLWCRVSGSGENYMTGNVTLNGETTQVVIFKNKFKKDGERTPDYRIYLSERVEMESDTASKPAPTKPAATKSAVKVRKEAEYEGVTLDEEVELDVPF